RGCSGYGGVISTKAEFSLAMLELQRQESPSFALLSSCAAADLGKSSWCSRMRMGKQLVAQATPAACLRLLSSGAAGLRCACSEPSQGTGREDTDRDPC